MAMLAANYPNDPIDVIMGDWMSEANMTSRAALKTESNHSQPLIDVTIIPIKLQMAATATSLPSSSLSSLP